MNYITTTILAALLHAQAIAQEYDIPPLPIEMTAENTSDSSFWLWMFLLAGGIIFVLTFIILDDALIRYLKKGSSNQTNDIGNSER